MTHGAIFITGRNKAEWFNQYAEYCRDYTTNALRG